MGNITNVNDLAPAYYASIMMTQAMENNSSSLPIYIGHAQPGTAQDAIGWQIRKITYDSNNIPTKVEFASGTNGFDKIWASRATYAYS